MSATGDMWLVAYDRVADNTALALIEEHLEWMKG